MLGLKALEECKAWYRSKYNIICCLTISHLNHFLLTVGGACLPAPRFGPKPDQAQTEGPEQKDQDQIKTRRLCVRSGHDLASPPGGPGTSPIPRAPGSLPSCSLPPLFFHELLSELQPAFLRGRAPFSPSYYILKMSSSKFLDQPEGTTMSHAMLLQVCGSVRTSYGSNG